MFNKKALRDVLVPFLAVVVFLLGACAPSPDAQPEDSAPTPKVQAATEPPPTATPIPTLPPTPTKILEPQLGPEESALSIEQVAGKWAIRVMGGGGGDPAVLILAEEGTFRIDGVGGEHAGMNLGSGTFHFVDGTLRLESNDCLILGPTDVFFTCTGIYNVFVSMADGKPARLRFAAVDDPFVDRRKTLDGKAFRPYREQ